MAFPSLGLPEVGMERFCSVVWDPCTGQPLLQLLHWKIQVLVNIRGVCVFFFFWCVCVFSTIGCLDWMLSSVWRISLPCFLQSSLHPPSPVR